VRGNLWLHAAGFDINTLNCRGASGQFIKLQIGSESELLYWSDIKNAEQLAAECERKTYVASWFRQIHAAQLGFLVAISRFRQKLMVAISRCRHKYAELSR
jgi:hypothetical protein